MLKKVTATILATIGAIAILTACDPAEMEAVAVKHTAPATVTTTRPLTQDERYVALLREYGITVVNEQAASEAAHSTCTFLEDYPQYTVDDMVSVLVAQDTEGSYTEAQYSFMLRTAVVIYCPQFSDRG